MAFVLHPNNEVIVFPNKFKRKGPYWDNEIVIVHDTTATSSLLSQYMTMPPHTDGEGPCRTTLEGITKNKDDEGVRRTIRIFRGNSIGNDTLLECFETNMDGTFSVTVDGSDGDEFTIMLMGENNEDMPVAYKVKGRAANG